MKSFLALIVGLSIFAIGCSHMETVNETYTATDPAFQRSFEKPKSDCLQASVKTLKEMGAGIDSQSGQEVISTRYNAFRFATTTGTASSATSVMNDQQAKIYLHVEDDGKGCAVKMTRVRAWNNGQEFEKIDVDFTKKMVATPFFRDLSERLSRL
ncbi:MAG: hypothetical protein H6623_02975 [Bdellovibrionaceae bacterium]|nr:hypothetical protein [Pseudobdellovibrionaceae bacterium]